jgi:hypothetical protein
MPHHRHPPPHHRRLTTITTTHPNNSRTRTRARARRTHMHRTHRPHAHGRTHRPTRPAPIRAHARPNSLASATGDRTRPARRTRARTRPRAPCRRHRTPRRRARPLRVVRWRSTHCCMARGAWMSESAIHCIPCRHSVAPSRQIDSAERLRGFSSLCKIAVFLRSPLRRGCDLLVTLLYSSCHCVPLPLPMNAITDFDILPVFSPNVRLPS